MEYDKTYMAQTTYGSITIVDITDTGSLSVYPTSNLPLSIVYDPNTGTGGTHTPNWSSNNLQLEPKIYYTFTRGGKWSMINPYFNDLTINITDLLPFTATIDDSLDKGLCDWLERIGAGRACGQKIQINFGEYPLFEFNPEFMKDANPESYAIVFHGSSTTDAI